MDVRFIRAAARRYWPLTVLLLTVLLPLYIFGQLAEEIYKKGGFIGDAAILRFLNRHASPTLDALMVFFSRAGAPLPMVVCFAGVLLALAVRRRRGDALFFAFAVAGAMTINVTAKLIFHRSRPDLWASLVPENDYSFPSGHAMGSMATVAALAFLTWRTHWRWPVLVGGGLFVALVGLSRLYLGVHYPSDVAAGWAASYGWVAGVRAVRAMRFPWSRPPASGPART